MSRTPAQAALRPAVLASILVLSASGLAQQAQAPTGADPRLTASLAGTLREIRAANGLEGVRLALTTVGNVVEYETTTQAAGRFLFQAIRPGQYLVVVVRDRYTFQIGRVALRGGEWLDRPFSKGVELAGTVTDERGAPVQAVTVCALTRNGTSEPARYAVQMWGRTNARGQFVLGEGADAPAGTYIAAVMPTGCGMVSSPDIPERLSRYPPAYAPGATSTADAREMPLDARSATPVDISLKPGPATRIDGRLVGYVNTTVAPGQVILEPPDGPVSIVRSTRISADGRFAFVGLTPGSYRLIVPPKHGPDPLKWAVQPVNLAGEPVRRVLVPLLSTMAIGGKIEFAGHLSMLYNTRVFLTVNAHREDGRRDVTGLLPAAWDGVLPDGVFGINGLMPGQYRLSVSGAEPFGWHAKSALYDGPPGEGPRLAPLDLFDAPLTIEQGKNVFGLVIKMTYLTTTTCGRIEDAANRPVPGAVVVVFSADTRYWLPRSRRMSVASADQDGRFRIEGLPEGEYLATAVRSAPRQPGPEFLESLRSRAVGFSLADGESKELVLRLAGKAPLPRRPGLNN